MQRETIETAATDRAPDTADASKLIPDVLYDVREAAHHQTLDRERERLKSHIRSENPQATDSMFQYLLRQAKKTDVGWNAAYAAWWEVLMHNEVITTRHRATKRPFRLESALQVAPREGGITPAQEQATLHEILAARGDDKAVLVTVHGAVTADDLDAVATASLAAVEADRVPSAASYTPEQPIEDTAHAVEAVGAVLSQPLERGASKESLKVALDEALARCKQIEQQLAHMQQDRDTRHAEMRRLDGMRAETQRGLCVCSKVKCKRSHRAELDNIAHAIDTQRTAIVALNEQITMHSAARAALKEQIKNHRLAILAAMPPARHAASAATRQLPVSQEVSSPAIPVAPSRVVATATTSGIPVAAPVAAPNALPVTPVLEATPKRPRFASMWHRAKELGVTFGSGIAHVVSTLTDSARASGGAATERIRTAGTTIATAATTAVGTGASVTRSTASVGERTAQAARTGIAAAAATTRDAGAALVSTSADVARRTARASATGVVAAAAGTRDIVAGTATTVTNLATRAVSTVGSVTGTVIQAPLRGAAALGRGGVALAGATVDLGLRAAQAGLSGLSDGIAAVNEMAGRRRRAATMHVRNAFLAAIGGITLLGAAHIATRHNNAAVQSAEAFANGQSAAMAPSEPGMDSADKVDSATASEIDEEQVHAREEELADAFAGVEDDHVTARGDDGVAQPIEVSHDAARIAPTERHDSTASSVRERREVSIPDAPITGRLAKKLRVRSFQELVTKWEEKYKGDHKGRIESTIRRMGPWYPIIVEEFEAQGLDPRIAVRMFIMESGFQQYAHSSARARGVAQATVNTARASGMIIDENQDDRVNVLKSIRFMAQHMRELINACDGDVEQALSCYNGGMHQHYARPVHQAGMRSSFPGYIRWLCDRVDKNRVKVPHAKENAEYVAQFLALSDSEIEDIIDQEFARTAHHIQLWAVYTQPGESLDEVADRIGVDVKRIRELNAEYRDPKLPLADGTMVIVSEGEHTAVGAEDRIADARPVHSSQPMSKQIATEQIVPRTLEVPVGTLDFDRAEYIVVPVTTTFEHLAELIAAGSGASSELVREYLDEHNQREPKHESENRIVQIPKGARNVLAQPT